MGEQRSDEAPDPPFVLKNRLEVLTYTVVSPLVCAGVVPLAMSLPLWVRSSGLGIVLLARAWGVNFFQSCVRCDMHGVSSSIGGGREFEWSEVERFESRRWHGVGVRLTDDPWVPLVRLAQFGRLTGPRVCALLEQQRLSRNIGSVVRKRLIRERDGRSILVVRSSGRTYLVFGVLVVVGAIVGMLSSPFAFVGVFLMSGSLGVLMQRAQFIRPGGDRS